MLSKTRLIDCRISNRVSLAPGLIRVPSSPRASMVAPEVDSKLHRRDTIMHRMTMARTHRPYAALTGLNLDAGAIPLPFIFLIFADDFFFFSSSRSYLTRHFHIENVNLSRLSNHRQPLDVFGPNIFGHQPLHLQCLAGIQMILPTAKQFCLDSQPACV
ncbi:hypothetical protein FVE85_0399 [Porphyridium purpureum]|uniref:Uncharacterized protein n=1 Tax=Porphyridium purpureum TaxID=35688 RepID=A0A5J4Z068_PORPP|nr:hypothetical protein FVE85_0399 [Porphyridium purpureum]|eukprot:POR1700..scf208_2